MKNPPLVALAFLASPALFILTGQLTRPTTKQENFYSNQHVIKNQDTEKNYTTTPSTKKPSDQPNIITINYNPVFDPRTPYSPAGLKTQLLQISFDPQDDYWGLPRTEGVDDVAAFCTACHSLEIVMQQRITPKRWQYTLNWMIEKQGMAKLDPETYQLIYAYLTRHFSNESQ